MTDTDALTSLIIKQMDSLSDQMRDQHTRLREDMDRSFTKLGDTFEKHEAEDRKVADRVLTIETERKAEASHAIKRGTWAGVLAAAGLSGVIEAIKAWRS